MFYDYYMSKLNQILESLIRWTAVVGLGLSPIFILPFTQNFYDTNKWILVLTTSLLIGLFWTIRLVASGTAIFDFTSTAKSLVWLTGAGLISLALASSNQVEALLSPFGPVTFAALAIIAIGASHALNHQAKSILRFLLIGSSFGGAVVAIVQFLGFTKPLLSSFPYIADPRWTPWGSSITLILFFILTLPLLVSDLWWAMEHRRISQSLIFGLLAVTVVAGLSLTVYQLLPIWQRMLLPLPAGWAITLEVLKNPRWALVGAGTENFIRAFTAGRPLNLNTSPVWDILFTTNSSLLLHLTATWGLVGTAAVLIFLKNLLRTAGFSHIAAPRERVDALSVALVVSAIFILLAPPSLLLLVATVTLLLLKERSSENYSTRGLIPSSFAWLRWGFGAILLGVIVAVGYGAARAYAAEVTFFKSLVAAQKGLGQDTYNLQIQAINLNPKISRFHIMYSQTNLALVGAIAQGVGAKEPKVLTDNDRQLIATLIQQAIREAKLGVTTAPGNALAWENLANVYQNLISVAEGADAWTIASFQQTIALDPTNPLLRLNFGGIYVGSKNYDRALEQFSAAAGLKPDYTNAYYNLANVYKLKGDTPQAIAALEKTLSLLKPENNDYFKAKNELEALKMASSPPPQPLQTQTDLTKPPTLQPLVVPPLELPSSAGPDLASPTAQTPPP